MKKALSLLIALALILTLPMTALADGEDLGDPVHLVVSLTAAENADYSHGIRAVKEYVEEKSGGNITMEIHYNASLFTQEEELTATSMGDCDITVTGPTWVAGNSPWMGMVAGFLFKNADHMSAVLNGEIGQEIYDRVAEEQNFMGLGAWYYGAREVSLSEDREVKTPDDLAGVNLRMANSEAWLVLGRSIGANVTPLSFSELYLALQTGVVDGQENPLPTLYSAKFYEVQKCIIMTNHQIDSVWPVINYDTWKGMTEAQQQILKDGMEAGRQVNDTRTIEQEEELLGYFEGEGMKIYYPDVNVFKTHQQEYYLNDPISADWDTELLEQIEQIGADY